MLVMYLCVLVIDVGHAFVCYVIDVSHVFVSVGYRCWSCICEVGVLMLLMYLCVRGVDVAHVSVC
jgi:multidrug transporter EmrE-like cation transporter